MSSSLLSLHLASEPVVQLTLEQVAREGARRALQKAVEDEVADYIHAHRDSVDERGNCVTVAAQTLTCPVRMAGGRWQSWTVVHLEARIELAGDDVLHITFDDLRIPSERIQVMRR